MRVWLMAMFGSAGRRVRRLWRRRELDPESTAGADRRLDAHVPAETLHGAAHDGQPDTGAGIGITAVKAFEDAEDALLIRRRDADAVVGHPDADPRIAPL